jgi:hypothetical protein
MRENIYARNITTAYKTFETVTKPAVKRISIGLPGQISTCRFLFADPPRLFYRDETNSVHLPGHIRFDKFIVTLNFLPSIGTHPFGQLYRDN